MIIVYWHRTNQLSVEQEAIFNNNIVDATMWIFLFEYLEGKLRAGEKSDERKINENYSWKKSIIKFLFLNIHVDNI